MPIKGEFFQNPGSDSAFYSHQIQHSARFDRDDQSYLTRDFGTLTAAKWTVSVWFKRVELGYAYSTLIGRTDGGAQLYFDSNDALINSSQYTNTVPGLYRDNGGWTNLVYNQKTVNTAAAWVNGVSRTVAVTGSGSFLIPWHTTSAIGNINGTGNTRFFDGYMAEIVGVYDQDLSNTNFGEFKNGVWIPIEPNVTFGSNDYYLKFNNDGVGILPSSITSAGTHAATGNIIGLFGNIGASAAPAGYNQTGQSDLSFTVDLGSAKTVGAWLGQGHQSSGYATRTATGTVSHSDNNSDFTSVGSSTYTFGNGVAPNGHTFTPSSHRYWKLSFPSASGGDGTSGYSLSAFYMQAAQSTSMADLGTDSSGNDNNWTVNNMGADHQVLDSPTFGSD